MRAGILRNVFMMDVPLAIALDLVIAYILHKGIQTEHVTTVCADATFYNLVLRRGLVSLSTDSILTALEICCQLLYRSSTHYDREFDLFDIWKEIDRLQQYPEPSIHSMAQYLIGHYKADEDDFNVESGSDHEVGDEKHKG